MIADAEDSETYTPTSIIPLCGLGINVALKRTRSASTQTRPGQKVSSRAGQTHCVLFRLFHPLALLVRRAHSLELFVQVLNARLKISRNAQRLDGPKREQGQGSEAGFCVAIRRAA